LGPENKSYMYGWMDGWAPPERHVLPLNWRVRENVGF